MPLRRAKHIQRYIFTEQYSNVIYLLLSSRCYRSKYAFDPLLRYFVKGRFCFTLSLWYEFVTSYYKHIIPHCLCSYAFSFSLFYIFISKIRYHRKSSKHSMFSRISSIIDDVFVYSAPYKHELLLFESWEWHVVMSNKNLENIFLYVNNFSFCYYNFRFFINIKFIICFENNIIDLF